MRQQQALLQRNNRAGFKAGALNAALDHLVSKREQFSFILFFDADHVPRASLSLLRSRLASPGFPRVAQFFWDDGLPLEGPIDWLTYSARHYSNWNIYNRSFTNLTGSAMAIDYSLIVQGLRFPDSVTEDYALSLALAKAGERIEVVPLVLSIGKSPKDFRAFVKQQMRWAEGTIRDAIDNAHLLKDLGWSGKMDFILHANMYAQGIWILLSAISLFLLGVRIDYVALALIAVQLVAYFATLRKAPKRFWPFYFVLNYVMAPFQIYACVKGLLQVSGHFRRTVKFGE